MLSHHGRRNWMIHILRLLSIELVTAMSINYSSPLIIWWVNRFYHTCSFTPLTPIIYISPSDVTYEKRANASLKSFSENMTHDLATTEATLRALSLHTASVRDPMRL